MIQFFFLFLFSFYICCCSKEILKIVTIYSRCDTAITRITKGGDSPGTEKRDSCENWCHISLASIHKKLFYSFKRIRIWYHNKLDYFPETWKNTSQYLKQLKKRKGLIIKKNINTRLEKSIQPSTTPSTYQKQNAKKERKEEFQNEISNTRGCNHGSICRTTKMQSSVSSSSSFPSTFSNAYCFSFQKKKKEKERCKPRGDPNWSRGLETSLWLPSRGKMRRINRGAKLEEAESEPKSIFPGFHRVVPSKTPDSGRRFPCKEDAVVLFRGYIKRWYYEASKAFSPRSSRRDFSFPCAK